MSPPIYYSDDSCTIYHGEACAVLAQLPEASCDVLLTDPPYSSGGMFRGDRARDPVDKYVQPTKGVGGVFVKQKAHYGTFGGDARDQRTFQIWSLLWMSEALRVCAPGSRGFVFSDWRQLPAVTDAFQLGGWTWRGVLTWDKGPGVGMPVRGRFRNNVEFVAWATHGYDTERVDDFPDSAILKEPIVSSGKEHATQKPVGLVRQLLSIVPTPHATILDPFMGSGTALRAAKDLNCKAIGIEIEERYCEIAARRLGQEVLAL